MLRSALGWVSGWAAASGLSVLLLAACGSDDGSGGEPGSGGTGAAGAAGSSGSGGGGGAAGSGDSGGSGGSAASGGSGGDPNCNDPGPEPNDTVPKATPVCASPPCEIGCSNSAGGSVTGVLSSGDVDLHTYYGTDSITCIVNATTSTEDSGFRLCMFVRCKDGQDATIKSCKDGSTQETGPDGMVGCCAPAPTSFEIDHDCPGTDEASAVYLRVDEATACIGYTVDYHY
jgi:hypothetical protein